MVSASQSLQVHAKLGISNWQKPVLWKSLSSKTCSLGMLPIWRNALVQGHVLHEHVHIHDVEGRDQRQSGGSCVSATCQTTAN